MGSIILRGITTALLVTVLALLAGIIWATMGFGGLSVSQLLDIGLLVSCLVAGYRTAKESGNWLMGGVAGAGYVMVGTLLLALFLPIRGWGFVQVLAESVLIGLVAGAFGAGSKGNVRSVWSTRKNQSPLTPSYESYGTGHSDSSEFDWDNDSLTSTSNGSKHNSQDAQGAKKNANEGSVIEWPWDREKKNQNLLSSCPESSTTFESWEPELIGDDVNRWNSGREEKTRTMQAGSEKICQDQIRDLRPWWEQ